MKPTALVLLALLTAGCGPSLTLMTPAPPTREIRLVRVDFADDIIELSEGVAAAFDCYRVGSSCKELHAVVADPHVARVFPAHFARLQPQWAAWEETNTSTLALVGIRPGETTVDVTAQGHTSRFTIRILAASDATVHATAAR